MIYDPENVFAKIIRGELPCHLVYEDEFSLAFLDIAPQSLGHTVVTPKHSCRNLLDADDEALAKTIVSVKKVAAALKQVLNADGVLVIQRSEAAAAQSVFHLHFNVLPRYSGQALLAEGVAVSDHEALADLAEKIRETIS